MSSNKYLKVCDLVFHNFIFASIGIETHYKRSCDIDLKSESLKVHSKILASKTFSWKMSRICECVYEAKCASNFLKNEWHAFNFSRLLIC